MTSALKKAVDAAEIVSEATGIPTEKIIGAPHDDIKRDNDSTQDVGGISGQRLKSYIERIERLQIEHKELAEDIKDIYAEARAFGFDVKIMRKVIRIRAMDTAKRQEESALLEAYLSAIGLQGSLF